MAMMAQKNCTVLIKTSSICCLSQITAKTFSKHSLMDKSSEVGGKKDNNTDPSLGIWVSVWESSPRRGGWWEFEVTGAKKIFTMAELDLCLAVTENTLQALMQLGSLFDFSFKKLR